MNTAEPQDPESDFVSLRRSAFLATGAGLTAVGLWLIWQRFSPNGRTPIEWTLMVLFGILFLQLAFGFSIAFWGFITCVRGGDRAQIMRDLPEILDGGEISPTAIVMPVFNEDVDRVFRGLEAMVRSLEETGQSAAFDFYILSDSNRPDRWIAEEAAWLDLCSRLSGFGHIFYRKRRVSLHGKSGNIADFCRRWGKRYRYLIILDADSIMTGSAFVRLARAMDANPTVGIIQTAPKLVRGTTVLQRLLQFTTSVVGPVFAAGSNFWQLAGGNYWGHNAILRLQPFMEHCVLPELPVKDPDARHIMSHDTVEAALMQQAGYEVWLANEEPGSWEEGPPDLTESLKRDRRWCQGNLQHFWFLFAPETNFSNRVHIFFGLMAYITSPLLVLSIILGGVDAYWADRYAQLSSQPEDPAWSSSGWATMNLLWLTIALLFLPKVLGTLTALPRAKDFGGVWKLFLSSVLETFLAILLAPVMLFFYTKFVLLTMLGIRVSWKTQNRSGSGVSFGDALRNYWQPTLTGIIAAAACLYWTPDLFWWLSPLLAGWLLSIPLVIFTASEAAGEFLRRHQLLLTPEEKAAPAELAFIEHPAAPSRTAAEGGLRDVFQSPYTNAIHLSFLRRNQRRTHYKAAYLNTLRERLLRDGPSALSTRETMALLWDPEAVAATHRSLWSAEPETLHSAWLS
ncbi:MAG TPA: glucans biosynthesis glucosyltransferase MdoH [Chthoniobacterales bacterium]|jgi:membrane glycosyltransferase